MKALTSDGVRRPAMPRTRRPKDLVGEFLRTRARAGLGGGQGKDQYKATTLHVTGDGLIQRLVPEPR